MSFRVRAAALAWAFAPVLAGAAAAETGAASSCDEPGFSRSQRAFINNGALHAALTDAAACAALTGRESARTAASLRALADVRVLLGDAAGAERELRAALQLVPGDAEAAYRLAQVLRAGPKEALAYAVQASTGAATDRRRAAAFLLAAEIRLDLGDVAGARAAAARALELSGEDLDALRVMIRLLRDHPDESSVYALRASRVAAAAPLWSRPAALRFCARLWLDQGDAARAAEAVRGALALNPDDRDALRMMLKLRQQHPETAASGAASAAPEAAPRTREALELALKSDPEDVEALRQLIALERRAGRLPEAADLADRLAEAGASGPAWRLPSALRLAARTWIELGETDRADQSILRAQTLDWQSLENETLAAEIVHHDGRDREAAEHLSGAYLASASAHVELGEFARARENIKRALALFPGNPMAPVVIQRLEEASNPKSR